MMLNVLQKTMFDGMRYCYSAMFMSADIAQEQSQKAWAAALEQNGKLRNEMEGLIAAWMLDAKKEREKLQLDLERSLQAVEESLGDPRGLSLAEMQAEAMRAWMGIWGWGLPLNTSSPGDEKERAKERKAKDE